MNTEKDLYAVLGVPRNATQDQIKKAYRDLARKHHPDMNQGDKESEEKFKEIQHAYETLSDPEKKKSYDMFGTSGFGGQRTSGGSYRQYSRGFPDIDEIFKDIFSQGGGAYGMGGAGGSFGDIFDFGNVRQQPRKPKNIQHTVTLDFETAVKGGEKELLVKSPDGGIKKIMVKIPAGVKTGSKVRLPGKGEQMNSMAGDLILEIKVLSHPVFKRENDDIYIDLPLTVYEAALGTLIDVPTIESPVKLTIPPGVGSGTRMRLREKGVKNPKTGKRGDQFVVVQIAMPKESNEHMKKLMDEIKEKYPYDPR
ncbi:MAG: DnaJ domain-containing protein, partial [Candidatus Dadabacteria bacterium]|nr:DnaJ domain-containing protein [Candidatus Dadabacteria bacterium]